jgi:hypothetical protein
MTRDPVELPLDDHAQLVYDYVQVCADLDELNARKEELREQLIPLIKDGDVITVGGQPLLRHSWSNGSERVNSQWLRKTWPDIYAASLQLTAGGHRVSVVVAKP